MNAPIVFSDPVRHELCYARKEETRREREDRWSARTRHSKQHHLLLRKLLAGVVVLRDAAGGYVAFLFSVRDIAVLVVSKAVIHVVANEGFVNSREHDILREFVSRFESTHFRYLDGDVL